MAYPLLGDDNFRSMYRMAQGRRKYNWDPKELRRQKIAANQRAARSRIQNSRRMRANVTRGVGALGVEYKHLDCERARVNLQASSGCTNGRIDPNAGCVGCLNAPAVGDGPSNRDGRRINGISILVQGVVDIPPPAAAVAWPAGYGPEIFIALVLDKQTNGASSPSESVFANIGANFATNIVPFRNLTNTLRYDILAQKRITLRVNDASAAALGGVHWWGVSQAFKLKSKRRFTMQFSNGTGADIANVVDNTIFLVAWCSDPTLVPAIQFGSRFTFVG